MLIKVKVFPKSKKDKVIKKSGDAFEVNVKEPALRGRANRRALELLSLYFNLPQEKIRLVRGGKQRNKIFELKI